MNFLKNRLPANYIRFFESTKNTKDLSASHHFGRLIETRKLNYDNLSWYLYSKYLRDFGSLGDYVKKMIELEKMANKKTHISREFSYLNTKLSSAIEEIKKDKTISEKETICFAVCVWGRSHLEALDRITMQSLFCEKQTSSLRQKYKFILYLQIGSVPEVEKQIFLEKYRGEFDEIKVLDITDETTKLQKFKKVSKYDLLGYLQTLQLLFSKQRNAHLFPFLPDLYYSSFYISTIVSLSLKEKKAILQPAFRSTARGFQMVQRLKKRTGRNLLNYAELGQIAYQTIAPESKQWVINQETINSGIFPNSHMLIYANKNRVTVQSPHFHCNFIPNYLIKKLKERFYFTLDSELDLVVSPVERIYHQKDEKLFCAHFSDFSSARELYYKFKYKNKNRTLKFLLGDIYQHRRDLLNGVFKRKNILPILSTDKSEPVVERFLVEIFEMMNLYLDKLYEMKKIIKKEGFYERI